MENKKLIYTKVIFLVVGIFAGWLVWGSGFLSSGTHVMTSGHIMKNGDESMESMMYNMNYNLLGKSEDEFDEAFINEMIVHHQGAIDMAKLVLEKSEKPELISLANEIIVAQTKEIEQMIFWKKNWFE
ncbi:MAG: hypothetical protein QG594_1852 [Bacteroidota bacterium]|nr:hypothetical protein [Bacteroidota bacterium]